MRLLNTHTFTLSEFAEDEVDPYVTLSHRWERDELTFQDLRDGTYHNKQGYHKAHRACQIAKSFGYQWLWIDTCCIDKRNSVELNEAINAMYRWYQKSDFCIAYLVDYAHLRTDLSYSSWFKRCWTLQELIAPPDVQFYDFEWTCFGSKRDKQLSSEISRITRITEHVLLGGDPKEYSIAQRLSWAADRRATRIEDETYSLLGIFGISMSTKYGTGTIVFRSLQKKLQQDLSLLAWARSPEEQIGSLCGLLAPSPAHFYLSHKVKSLESKSREMVILRDCVELDALSVPHAQGIYLCILRCTSTDSSYRRAIFLQRLEGGERYARLLRGDIGVVNVHMNWVESLPPSVCRSRKFYIDHSPAHPPCDWLPGIMIRHIMLPGYNAPCTEIAHGRSRCGEKFNLNNHPILLQLPPNEWGTTGVIHMPAQPSHSRNWKIHCIKVGFDADFRPTVWLGNHKSAGTARITREVMQSYDESNVSIKRSMWDNTWLDKNLPSLTNKISSISKVELEELNGEEQFKKRGFERHKALDDEGLDLDLVHLGIRLRLTLETLPQPRSEQRTRSIVMSGRKVWTLRIDMTGPSIPVHVAHAIKKRNRIWGGLVATSMLYLLSV